MKNDLASVPEHAPRSEPKPSAFRPNVAQVAVGVGAVVAGFDGSSVNAILPVIGRAFDADVATLQWIPIGYLLVQTGLLLSFGRLGDMLGHKRVYLSGLIVIVLGAALSGLATSPAFLIGSRAFQALGGSMTAATAAAILTRMFPAKQRGRVLGMQTTMVYLGLSSGPPVGGLLAEAIGWRAVFFVTGAVGLLALGLSARLIPTDLPAVRRERFDLVGAATYILGLVGVLLGLNRGHDWGWTSPAILGSVVVGLVLLVVFAAIELRIPSPMLDLRLFRRRAFAAPVLSSVLNYVSVNAAVFLMPFYLIQGRGISPAQAGLIMIAQPIVMATTASLSGALSDRIGSRTPATVGMLVLAAGVFLLSRLGESAAIWNIAGTLAIVGLGVGLFTSPNTSSIMGAVPAERRGVASSVVATARTLGTVLGVGIAGAVFSTGLAGRADTGPNAVVGAVSVGLAVASVVALLGALTSSTRPGVSAD